MAVQSHFEAARGRPEGVDVDLRRLLNLVERLADYRDSRVSLISSENVTSNLLRASYSLGLSDQYCSRLPSRASDVGNLSFSNISALDEVNDAARRLAMELFDAAEVDLRPLSGLSGLNILLFALLESGQLLHRIDETDGGHLSTGPITRRLGIRTRALRLNARYRLDLDHFRRLVEVERPSAVMLDSSYVLFPYPVAAIREIVGPDVTIIYDASHLIAMVATGEFQSPFGEGADVIHATTHKTLWGPQKSMVLFRRQDERVARVQDVAKDLVSNTHLHHMLALYVALVEFRHFGREYARGIKANAKSFAAALRRHGLDVVAADQDFTESNQVWVRLGGQERATALFRLADRTNVSVNVIFLPGGGWGWRLGVNELTRLGAGAAEFDVLAALLAGLVSGRLQAQDVTIEAARLRRSLGAPKFTFDRHPDARRTIELISSRLRAP
jgi:glycine hydroxymethyltransferase